MASQVHAAPSHGHSFPHISSSFHTPSFESPPPPVSLENSTPELPSSPPKEFDEETPDIEFDGLPPFPKDIPIAPLLRISLKRLLQGEQTEVDRLWRACCDLGFFYLDLRGGRHGMHRVKSAEQQELTQNVWGDGEGDDDDDIGAANSTVSNATTGSRNGDRFMRRSSSITDAAIEVDGDQLLADADALFPVGEQIFSLPLSEKLQYDFSSSGSYFGYKGHGAGVIDARGTADRNEFYNACKNDIIGIAGGAAAVPAPSVLSNHRPLLKSYIEHSHAIVTLLLRLLNARLDLPSDKLPSLHRLHAPSGDQIRWVSSPLPQAPAAGKPAPSLTSAAANTPALGAHTDFGSVTILFNRLGGLQVLPPGPSPGEWRYVKPLRGHAVVNLGDAMVKFTAGVLRSNLHRVVDPPGAFADGEMTTRMSLVYFARPEDDVALTVLRGSALIDERRKGMVEFKGEETATAKEWIERRALGRRHGGDWAASTGTEGERVAE